MFDGLLPSCCSEGAVGARLGNYGETVGTDVLRRKRRIEDLAQKRFAASILEARDPTRSRAMAFCSIVPTNKGVTLWRSGKTGKAFFTGLQHCAHGWLCIVCARKIAAVRKAEIDLFMKWAARNGFSSHFMTLTARHDRAMELEDFLDRLLRAVKALKQSREWTRIGRSASSLKREGSIKALEATYGMANGWHPHFHEMFAMAGDPVAARAALECLRSKWLHCLKAEGLSGNRAAFDLQDGSAAGSYLAKYGPSEEMALAVTKKGRKGGRTPWQLLEDAQAGDKFAARRWLEFASAIKGKSQLTWSPGLKARVGVEDVSDADAVEEVIEGEAGPAPDVKLRHWEYGGDWHLARLRWCSLLEAAESGGDLDTAECAMTDQELYDREWPDRSLECET